MNLETDYLSEKIPEIVSRMSLKQRQEDLLTLEEIEQDGHLSRINPFWREYLKVIREQRPRLTLEQAQKLGVEQYRWGIEHCVVRITKEILARSVKRAILRKGGSLETGLPKGRLTKGEEIGFHVHTNDPEAVLEYLRKLGEIQGEPVIENLEEQVRKAGIVKF